MTSMNTNPFQIIKHWIDNRQMSAIEKRTIREQLVSYATTHPVKSGLLSPYTFRYATVALASLIIVLGGSAGLATASARALPNQKLYPVKMWIEDFQSKNQDTPEAIIAFETKRIETRFQEATELAMKQRLDDSASAIVQAGLEHSRVAIRNVADTIQNQNPELALAATNDLETSFSSNGKILAAIEKNTGQNIGTIVLAAQVTTKNLATEKIKFEQIVATKPNDATKTATEYKLAVLEKRLTALSPEIVVDTTLAIPAPVATTTSDVAITSMAMTMDAPEPMTKEIPHEDTPEDLVAQAKEKMTAGLYSEALVLLQKAEQILDESKLTKSLEKTYQVQVKTEANLELESPTTIPIIPLPAPTSPSTETTEGASISPVIE